MRSLRLKLSNNQKTANEREKKIFNEHLADFILPETMLKALVSSQNLNGQQLIKIEVEDPFRIMDDFAGKSITLEDMKKYIESNWNSKYWESQYISAKFISLLPREEVINYLPYLAVLVGDWNNAVKEAAIQCWNALKPEKWAKDFPEQLLEPITKFIEDNWDSNKEEERYASALLIPLLPRNLVIRYLPKLAILIQDGDSAVQEAAQHVWNFLKPEKWITKMSIKILKPILGFIDESWNSTIKFLEERRKLISDLGIEILGSRDWENRYASALLISVLPRKAVLNYLPYLLILTKDMNEEVKEIAIDSLTHLKPEKWLKTLSDKELEPILNFIENDWKSRNWEIRYASIKLISLLSKEKQILYFSILTKRAYDINTAVRSTSIISLLKLSTHLPATHRLKIYFYLLKSLIPFKKKYSGNFQ